MSGGFDPGMVRRRPPRRGGHDEGKNQMSTDRHRTSTCSKCAETVVVVFDVDCWRCPVCNAASTRRRV